MKNEAMETEHAQEKETLSLPETFEAYSRARQEGFLHVKQMKEDGKRVAGIFCTFTPYEILDVAGFYAISLCASSEETIPAAETELPKNLCPLIKSSYGFAITDKCPYTYFSDIIIGETTCDGKKKMYELLGKRKPVHILHLPQSSTLPYALPMWTMEMHRLIDALTDRFGVEITEEKLREAARIRNAERKEKMEFMELQKLDPPAMSGMEMFQVMNGSMFQFPIEEQIEELHEFTARIRQEYDEGKRMQWKGAKRILITGCPIGGVIDKTVAVVEQCGGVCVCFENCCGVKAYQAMVDLENPDIVEAIADRYLQIGCAVMTPNPKRMKLLTELIEEYQIDGVVDITLQSCHPFTVEGKEVHELCSRAGVPYLGITTDFSTTDIGQITTRIEAFLELLDI